MIRPYYSISETHVKFGRTKRPILCFSIRSESIDVVEGVLRRVVCLLCLRNMEFFLDFLIRVYLEILERLNQDISEQLLESAKKSKLDKVSYNRPRSIEIGEIITLRHLCYSIQVLLFATIVSSPREVVIYDVIEKGNPTFGYLSSYKAHFLVSSCSSQLHRIALSKLKTI